MKQNKSAIFVTHKDLPSGVIRKHMGIITDTKNWHKFIVVNRHFNTRDVVLRAILDFVHPLDLFPVAYVQNGRSCSFLARNCSEAIKRICQNNMLIPDPNMEVPFEVNLYLAYTTGQDFSIDVQENLLYVLNKRYDPNERVLDLRKFHEDPDLTEFCPLSQPKIMFYVAHLIKAWSHIPVIYLLQNNFIKTVNLSTTFDRFTMAVATIDLSNNLIVDLDSLENLKNFNVKHLYLDGNPICALYDAITYKNKISAFLPSIKTLDGTPIAMDVKKKRNFLCNPEGLDLVNQFLEHYFTLYDSKNRAPLQMLYHKSALFSLNCQFHSNQVTSSNARIFYYQALSRNLKKMADISKSDQFLFKGPSEIMNTLSSLPATEHDPFSFQVDLISYTKTCAIVCVSGVFRQQPENLLEIDRTYGFHRTFVIQTTSGGGCYILNDMMHVYNAFLFQAVESFKISRQPQNHVMRLPSNAKEEQKLIEAVRLITNLTDVMSKIYLEKCHYDLKETLTLFIEHYKQDKIPDSGFIAQASSITTPLTYQNETEIADALVKYPNIEDRPPSLTAALMKFRPPHQPTRRCRRKFTTSAGQVIRICLPKGDHTGIR